MGAELQMTTRPHFLAAGGDSLRRFADAALRRTTQTWFAVTVLGQLLFAFTIAAFYGAAAARGEMVSWNRFMMRGHVAGDTVGNLAVAIHLATAIVILLAGSIQFVPSVRARFPAVHRWSGRFYMLSAVALSAAGVYMQWVRGSNGDTSQRIGSTGNAIFIWICAALALRRVLQRDLRGHRVWALRLYLVVSASWFFRIGFFLTMLVFGGPVGFDPVTFSGPFLTFMSYAVYLVPLAILELYLRAQSRPGPSRRLAMAAVMVLLTVGTIGGTFAVSASTWAPAIRTAFDSRRSLAQELSRTIAASGVDAAIDRYRVLKATQASVWNFDEGELNRLGYELLRSKKVAEAIRIFELNTSAYPRSANTWDSLGEGYLAAGDRSRAITNYRKALELNPDSGTAIAALRKLGSL